MSAPVNATTQPTPASPPAPVIALCFGSACHQRRGYRLLPIFEELIARHGLAGRIELKGAFCLENCPRGPSVKVGDRVFSGIEETNAAEFFEREILPLCPPA